MNKLFFASAILFSALTLSGCVEDRTNYYSSGYSSSDYTSSSNAFSGNNPTYSSNSNEVSVSGYSSSTAG